MSEEYKPNFASLFEGSLISFYFIIKILFIVIIIWIAVKNGHLGDVEYWLGKQEIGKFKFYNTNF